MKVIKVGLYCRNFRLNVLKMTLQDVSNLDNFKTLSAFEHGRSRNIMHIYKYIEACENRDDRIKFIRGLCELMEVENND